MNQLASKTKSVLKSFSRRGSIYLILTALLAPLVTLSSPSSGASLPPSCVTPVGTHYALLNPSPYPSFITRAIDQATSSIDLTIYELNDPVVVSDLISAANRGIQVRVLLDRAYSGYYENSNAYRTLGASKVSVRYAPANVIYHQKTLTIDHACSFIGTGNLTPRYYRSSIDFWVLDNYSVDVSSIESTFARDFTSSSPIKVALTGSLVYSPGAEAPLVSLIDSARHSIFVSAAEMRDSYITTPLAAAARRGVRCSILMTQNSAYDSVLGALRAAGCTIRLYPDTSTSPYVHAKVILVDYATPTARVFIGSQNISISSLIYDRELGLILTPRNAAGLVNGLHSALTRDFSRAPIVYH